ncbi:MAG: hypothetical protein Fur0025_41020 [Oscillatoriaceae cyanobacterium]
MSEFQGIFTSDNIPGTIPTFLPQDDQLLSLPTAGGFTSPNGEFNADVAFSPIPGSGMSVEAPLPEILLPQTASATAATDPNIDIITGTSATASGDILFDPEYYAATNPDLGNAGLTTTTQLYEHWQTYGLNEHRSFSRFV